MMLLARELGEEVTGYWKRESRTQQEILGIISMMTDVAQEDIKTGVDGCGVPVYAVPFHSIATSYLPGTDSGFGTADGGDQKCKYDS